MCPSVSGITTKDAALSVELGMRAVDLALGPAALASPVNNSDSSTDSGVLKPGGHLVIKLLESQDAQGERLLKEAYYLSVSFLGNVLIIFLR